MKASQLLLLYQCSLCVSTLIEMDDLSSDFEKTFDNAFGNPHGILAKGLMDPGKFESIFNSLLYNMDEKNDDQLLPNMYDNTDNINVLPLQQKRKGDYNMVRNEVEEQQRAIPDRTSFNAVRSYGMIFSRPFRPKIRLEVTTGDTFQEGLSFDTSIPLRPNMDIVDSIFSAALQQYLRFPKRSNPYNVILDYDRNKDCDIVVSALNIPNDGVHTWKVKVTRRRGRVIYEDECITTSRRFRLRHGTKITIYYS